MSLIHIARNNAVLGQYAEDAVRDGLANGTFLLSDLAWKDGMAEWKTLSQWPEFAAGAAALSGAAPIAATTIPEEPPAPEWERTPSIGYWPAFWQTVKGILFSPSATFSAFPKSLSFLKSYIFFIACGIIATLLGLLVTNIIGDPILPLIREFLAQIAETTGDTAILDQFDQAISQQQTSIQKISGMVGSVVGLLIVPFISAGITHIFLMLFAGAEKRFDATFRVVAYSAGALSLINWIPFIGPLIYSPYSIVLSTIGLSKVHDISLGKALLITLAPMVLCCLLFITCGGFAVFALLAA